MPHTNGGWAKFCLITVGTWPIFTHTNAINFDTLRIDQNRLDNQFIVAFANDRGPYIERLICDRFCGDQLFAIHNCRPDIKDGKAIFHTETLPVEVGHHVLDPGVILEAIGGQILAISRVLEATVRHLRRQGQVGVDPNGAKIKCLRESHR